MLSTVNSALLVLTAYAFGGLLASPLTPEHVATASNLAAELAGSSGSDIPPSDPFRDSTVIFYRYECPVGGIESRFIRIGADFHGEGSTFYNIVNAEKLSVTNIESIGKLSYRVTGQFQHKMCLARNQFRSCGYSLSAALQGTVRIDDTSARFDIPTTSGPHHGAPIVTETCTRINGHAKDCTPVGKPVRCKVLHVASTA